MAESKEKKQSKSPLVLLTCCAISGNKAHSAERVVGPAAYEGVGVAAACWPKQRTALAPPPPPPPPRRRLETTTTAAAASALGVLAPPCCCCCSRLFLSLWLLSLTSRARLLLMLGQVGETASSQADMKMKKGKGKEEKKGWTRASASNREPKRERLLSLSLSLSLSSRALLSSPPEQAPWRSATRARRSRRERAERAFGVHARGSRDEAVRKKEREQVRKRCKRGNEKKKKNHVKGTFCSA